MALKLIANYSKRLGLPGYSSHQFSVCVETEISSNDDIQGESARLYRTLQQSVDLEIQQTGFVPGEAYGAGNAPGLTNGNNGQWKCSDKQRDLILQLIQEHQIDKAEVENMAVQMFQQGVRSLNKLQASGLIDEMIRKYVEQEPSSRSTRGNGSRPFRRPARAR